ncbi:MAG: hypothetical protein QXD04_03425 [Candidatus Bathyarchaeia archaeon]|nr:hypothetical protein [Candidatus Bathyarchaeota archaeon]
MVGRRRNEMNLESIFSLSIFNPFSLVALLPLILLFVLFLLYIIGGGGGRSSRMDLERRRWSRTPALRRRYR